MLKFVIESLIFIENALEKMYAEAILAAILLFLEILSWIIGQIKAFFMFFNNAVTLGYGKMQSRGLKCIKTVFCGGHLEILDVQGICSHGMTSRNVYTYVF